VEILKSFYSSCSNELVPPLVPFMRLKSLIDLQLLESFQRSLDMTTVCNTDFDGIQYGTVCEVRLSGSHYGVDGNRPFGRRSNRPGTVIAD